MKIIKNTFLNIFLFFATVSFSLADTQNIGTIPNPLTSNSLNEFFSGIITVVLQIGTIISALAIMYGGLLYATAQGDEEKIVKAYKTMTWAIVGTVVLLGANVIMKAIQGTIAGL